jgi:hypothetical protein
MKSSFNPEPEATVVSRYLSLVKTAGASGFGLTDHSQPLSLANNLYSAD